MGGKGSGGSRVGAGAKRKDSALALVHGSRGLVSQKPSPYSGVVSGLPAVVESPSDLPAEQAVLWDELAPHALASHTLTPETALAFRDLLEAIVVKRALLARVESDGLVYIKVTVDGTGAEHQELKSHTLLVQFRGLMQRVEAGMARFRLTPDGKDHGAVVVPQELSALEKLQAQAQQMRRVR